MTQHSVQAMQTQSLSFSIPPQLETELRSDIPIKEIGSPFKDPYYSLSSSNEDTTLGRLIIYAYREQDQNIRSRIIAYIVHQLELIDFTNQEAFDQAFAPHVLGDNPLIMASCLTFYGMVIAILNVFKKHMTEQQFQAYLITNVPYFVQPPQPFFPLALSPHAITTTDESIGYPSPTTPIDVNSEIKTPHKEVLIAIIDLIKRGAYYYKNAFDIVTVQDWITKVDNHNNHLLAQLIRFIYVLPEKGYQYALLFVLELLDKLQMSGLNNHNLWILNNSGEDIIAMAILRGMSSLVDRLLTLREAYDPVGFKTYLITPQRHILILFKVFHHAALLEIFTKRDPEELHEDRLRVDQKLKDIYKQKNITIPNRRQRKCYTALQTFYDDQGHPIETIYYPDSDSQSTAVSPSSPSFSPKT